MNKRKKKTRVLCFSLYIHFPLILPISTQIFNNTQEMAFLFPHSSSFSNKFPCVSTITSCFRLCSNNISEREREIERKYKKKIKINKYKYKLVIHRNEKFYTCCDEPYLDITFNITMRRKTVNIMILCMRVY